MKMKLLYLFSIFLFIHCTNSQIFSTVKLTKDVPYSNNTDATAATLFTCASFNKSTVSIGFKATIADGSTISFTTSQYGYGGSVFATDVYYWSIPYTDPSRVYFSLEANPEYAIATPYTVVATEVTLDEITLKDSKVVQVAPTWPTSTLAFFAIQVVNTSQPLTISANSYMVVSNYSATLVSYNDASYLVNPNTTTKISTLTIDQNSSTPLTPGLWYVGLPGSIIRKPANISVGICYGVNCTVDIPPPTPQGPGAGSASVTTSLLNLVVLAIILLLLLCFTILFV